MLRFYCGISFLYTYPYENALSDSFDSFISVILYFPTPRLLGDDYGRGFLAGATRFAFCFG